MPTAIPTDVRAEIDTSLPDSDIAQVLQLVERDIDRAYGANPGFVDTQHRSDFEAALTALRIAEANSPSAEDRAASEVQTGRSTVSYESSVIDTLRQRVRQRDPGNSFSTNAGVVRDGARYVTSTDQ